MTFVASGESMRWPAGGRDPFVLPWDGRWLVFSVGVSEASRGRILRSESADREEWSEASVVVEDPRPSYPWGGLESPAIVEHDAPRRDPASLWGLSFRNRLGLAAGFEVDRAGKAFELG